MLIDTILYEVIVIERKSNFISLGKYFYEAKVTFPIHQLPITNQKYLCPVKTKFSDNSLDQININL